MIAIGHDAVCRLDDRLVDLRNLGVAVRCVGQLLETQPICELPEPECALYAIATGIEAAVRDCRQLLETTEPGGEAEHG